MKRILVTGGAGKFATNIKRYSEELGYSVLDPNKKQMDVTSFWGCERYFYANQFDFDYVIHAAGLSSPTRRHEKKPTDSIQKNIIGTANVTLHCERFKKKMIYISTNYVYPGTVGNYKENDSLLPANNYAWSKLGGESSVHLYNNSLILRVCMTEKPFVHKEAFSNVKTSFMYHEAVAKILFKLINKKGIINIGGSSMSIYDFARKDNKSIISKKLKKNNKIGMPMNSSLNINKMKKILR